MACYMLTNPVTGENLGETPHPAILGCVLLACDPRLENRYSCRFFRQAGKGKGKAKFDSTHFGTPYECVDHLHQCHLGGSQFAEVRTLNRQGISIRQVLQLHVPQSSYCALAVAFEHGWLASSPRGPRELPEHPSGLQHNRYIALQPYCYNSQGRRALGGTPSTHGTHT
eukprot:60591-Amphidinium_carterae.1